MEQQGLEHTITLRCFTYSMDMHIQLSCLTYTYLIMWSRSQAHPITECYFYIYMILISDLNSSLLWFYSATGNHPRKVRPPTRSHPTYHPKSESYSCTAAKRWSKTICGWGRNGVSRLQSCSWACNQNGCLLHWTLPDHPGFADDDMSRVACTNQTLHPCCTFRVIMTNLFR